MARPVLTVADIGGFSVLAVYLLGFSNGAEPLADELLELRALPAGVIEYQLAGEFRNGRRVVSAPKRTINIPGNLEIMRYPVTQAAYSKCVSEGGCVESASSGSETLPQTLVNYRDALDFAAWQSERTAQNWRLPTGPEWAYAAAERYEDEFVSDGPEYDDPAQRWIDAYRANIQNRDSADPTLKPLGTYGENAFGIAYLGGNTWEWTTTCFKKGEVNVNGELVQQSEDYCGVRLAQGVHRAFIIDFVRDASVGGCAVGLPPDHLVIRLIREN
ncbi:Formylglycine-generating sulfatase enzyme [Roseovarius albus]|uniref:Formylglycine-generating sulfatase enzyme n=1 Tax=Roseovarius albus TaxID=1247867 RepID=A0A1X6ZYJ9_9RHOB|nr:SUMF1/EgtB/PvdO family nonheme iron enzyme [Roseovarius albus]SLN65353.1 Formylglycine-generating sulfatase enzyme [Roseovarius albus]